MQLYSCPGLGRVKLYHSISQPIIGILQNWSHRRNQDIQTLPNLVSDLIGGQYKNVKKILYVILVLTRYKWISTFWDLRVTRW